MSDAEESLSNLEKIVAPESLKTIKAREKLRKAFEKLEQKTTKQALKQKSLEIHRWIARHAHHRVVLPTKTISLFDENQNAAKQSQKIIKVAQSLTNRSASTNESDSCNISE